MKAASTWGMLSLAICVAAQSATAQEVTIEPSKDTTLFESAGGTLSGGANLGLYVGRTLALNGFKLKRGLVAFDIAGSVPAGSSVTSVTLQMNAIKTGDLPAYSVSLHRALADWGEGTVGGDGGGGSAANAGDATWTQSFSGTTNWASLGGDFVAGASATTPVNTPAIYTWGSTSQMVADVQDWLNNPAGNFGWLIKLDTEEFNASVKKFASSDAVAPATRPQLTIVFGPPAPIPTVSQWGLVVMALLVIMAGTIAFTGKPLAPGRIH